MTDNARENIGYLLAGLILIGVVLNIWANYDHDHSPHLQEEAICPSTLTR